VKLSYLLEVQARHVAWVIARALCDGLAIRTTESATR
jgi:hypothetical protein